VKKTARAFLYFIGCEKLCIGLRHAEAAEQCFNAIEGVESDERAYVCDHFVVTKSIDKLDF
jgi:hypothetical protein